MSEIMRFSLYKNKVTKYLSGILLACFVIPICSAQPPQKNNVNDFRTATWNSNGPRWDEVRRLMNASGLDRLDVLAIQEAGNLRAINNELSPLGNLIPICYVGFELDRSSSESLGFHEFVWNTGGQTFYIYYYNTPVENPVAPGTSRQVTKQNMAIVSRQRADEMIIIPNETIDTPTNVAEAEQNSRTFINRPVLGIRIANSVFFNIHPEPRRDTRPNSTRVFNEAGMLVEVIENYMQTYYPTHTWMVMGDFNATPVQLRPNLPQLNNGRFINVLNTRRNTRASGELDYAVVGGPIANQAAINAIVAVLLVMVANPSDHLPVKFN